MPRDAAVGAVILAFAGLYWLAAGTIRRSSLEDSIGAAGLPNTLAALLAGLAILLIVAFAAIGMLTALEAMLISLAALVVSTTVGIFVIWRRVIFPSASRSLNWLISIGSVSSKCGAGAASRHPSRRKSFHLKAGLPIAPVPAIDGR